MKRALIYCRVSTSDKGQNPEVQAAALREFCTVRGWTIVEQIIDSGFSGSTDRRPGLNRLMAMARARSCDLVVVAKLDRLFRSLKHMVAAIDEFEHLGVQFVSMGDPIDMTTPSGKLLLHLLASFGEFERALIRERTMAGLSYARSQGKVLGRPKTRDDRAILNLRQKGFSYSEIQTQLGVSRPSIRRALIAAGGTKTPKNLGQKSQSYRRGHNA